jgi:hypothetical protein
MTKRARKMNRSVVTLLITTAFVLAFWATAPAQEDFPDDSVVYRKNSPGFFSYREPVYKGKIAAVKINSKYSRTYRTVLRDSVKESGVNFAGHYTLATWGCGTNCNQMAVVDVKTGQTYFTPGLMSVVMGVPNQSLDMTEFKANSRLLKVVGRTNGKDYGTWFYEWKNNQFKLVRAYKNQQVK